MKTLFIGCLAALATLAVLDALWLGIVRREFYKARLGQLLLDQPNWRRIAKLGPRASHPLMIMSGRA